MKPILTRCRYCNLPHMIHFAFCIASGIRGNMPDEALRDGAIMQWRGEERLPVLSPSARFAVMRSKVRDRLKGLDDAYRRPETRKL